MTYKNLRSTNPTEHQIQCAIVEWANATYVDHPSGGKVLLGSFLIKIANEGKRSWAQGKKMKKEGLKKGASDLFLAFPVGNFSGFWYEVKAPGKIPTDEQVEFLYGMRDIGYWSNFGDSVEKGVEDFKDYLGMK